MVLIPLRNIETGTGTGTNESGKDRQMDSREMYRTFREQEPVRNMDVLHVYVREYCLIEGEVPWKNQDVNNLATISRDYKVLSMRKEGSKEETSSVISRPNKTKVNGTWYLRLESRESKGAPNVILETRFYTVPFADFEVIDKNNKKYIKYIYTYDTNQLEPYALNELPAYIMRTFPLKEVIDSRQKNILRYLSNEGGYLVSNKRISRKKGSQKIYYMESVHKKWEELQKEMRRVLEPDSDYRDLFPEAENNMRFLPYMNSKEELKRATLLGNVLRDVMDKRYGLMTSEERGYFYEVQDAINRSLKTSSPLEYISEHLPTDTLFNDEQIFNHRRCDREDEIKSGTYVRTIDGHVVRTCYFVRETEKSVVSFVLRGTPVEHQYEYLDVKDLLGKMVKNKDDLEDAAKYLHVLTSGDDERSRDVERFAVVSRVTMKYVNRFGNQANEIIQGATIARETDRDLSDNRGMTRLLFYLRKVYRQRGPRTFSDPIDTVRIRYLFSVYVRYKT